MRSHLDHPSKFERTRRRRPVGEPPPLPRDLHGSARVWIAVIATLTAVYLWGKYGGPLAGSIQRSVDRWVTDVVIVPARMGSVDEVADDLRDLFGVWALVAVRWAVVIAMIVSKRWWHLAVFVGTVVLINVLALWFPLAGPEGHAPGFVGHPSLAEAGFVVTMLGIVYGLAPRGPWRVAAEVVTVVSSGLLGIVLILTDQNSFAEVAIGGVGATAIGVLGYRVFAPESVFPVRYRRGRTAHLDMTPERTGAVISALRDQLGLGVDDVKPFGLEGSGGSTPLRIDLTDGTVAFGKLYATSHLRSDRWYKLGRTILYGALEDERSFNSVRRMVEHEDHVFFCQVHPSPWRQSVDLANMMLTLALGSDAQTVYTTARARFADDEIAKAFAATRGVTIPSQLRHMLHEDDRNLLEAFRSLAPSRPRIPVQRWTLRRLTLLAGLIAGL